MLASAVVALLFAFTAVVAVTAIVVFLRFVARIVLLFGVGARTLVRSAPALSRLAPMESTPADNTRARARSSRAESTSSIEELGDATVVARAQVHVGTARATESSEVDRTLAILPRRTPRRRTARSIAPLRIPVPRARRPETPEPTPSSPPFSECRRLLSPTRVRSPQSFEVSHSAWR